MPAKPPANPSKVASELTDLGQRIRAQRKALGVSATDAAQAAGLSRVTLHRIESGNPAVTMGAYMNTLAALGLGFQLTTPLAPDATPPTLDREKWIPVRVSLADYPQLKKLAWQVHGTDTLTPQEALGLYERNARHIDIEAMTADEKQLWAALRNALGQDGQDV